ncbi:MAG: heme-binding protein [Bacteroidetes bacterium]|nr:MAG: heme-binding protein [Bacteroidota bacterium]
MSIPSRSLSVVLRSGAVLGLLAVLAGCGPQSPDPTIKRMDPDRAARMADSIRQTVDVQIADGLALSLWAVDSLAPDPIALAIDDLGRAYITRTNRQKHSEFDIRGYPHWMTESIAFETVEDRRAFLHRTFAPERSDSNAWLADLNGDSLHDWRDLAVEKEQVFRIEDVSGDGVADQAQLFIEDFHTEVTDVAGAVLPFGGDVFLGVAPDLWRLRDTDGDGAADTKTSISSGYAVHIGFSGHGMSGLTVGPDGRIYWSIGDIGLNVTDPSGRQWAYPNQGAILRANPDGSDFEVFAAGVRNTHEFVFDAYGNLISVDNDGDHPGEQERVVYLINGSDSGWRTNWQFGKYTDPDNNTYKVWMDEQMYTPRFEGQAAYFLPPIANYHSGPAGMAYNPGTALSADWQDRFFVAEFTGSSARSRVFAFRLEPEGAGFRFAGEEEVTRGILAVGIDFGPDGALYMTDWLEGWGTKDIGRIWKLDVPGAATSDLRLETKALLAEDFGPRTGDELFGLLQHPDLRVRQKAQFELAGRDDFGTEPLLAAVRQTEHQLARLHGLWGLGQLIRQGIDVGDDLVPFLNDADPEIRAQTAKVLGDVRYRAAAEAVLPLLDDDYPRARLFAAEALGRMRYRGAVQPILDMLEANDDVDTYLRHGGAIALARIGEAEPLVALAGHPSRALRIAAVVALRRMRHPGVAQFLHDADPYVVTEAARAINDDLSIEAALPALAEVLEEDRFTEEALLRRALNANLRVGTAEAAERVARFAARRDAPEAMRAEALAILGVWPRPSVLDRVDGRYRGPVSRDPALARNALGPILEPLLTGGQPAIQVAAAEAAGRLRYEPAAPTLLSLVRSDRNPDVRRAALDALHTAGDARTVEAVQTALADRDRRVRMRALELVPGLPLPAEEQVRLLASVVGRRSVQEQQAALATLAQYDIPAAHEVLGDLLERLEAGTLAPEIQLDVVEAVASSSSDTLKSRLADYEAAQSDGDVPAAYRTALYGGDPDRGRQLFFRHQGAQCVRCHAVGGRGGDVGPPLSGIGARLSREQLLESLVAPSARIAPGYGMVSLRLRDGTLTSGTLLEETDTYLVLRAGEGEPQRIETSAIAERQTVPSAMPPMDGVLTRRGLRDVVAFLATLQEPDPSPAGHGVR